MTDVTKMSDEDMFDAIGVPEDDRSADSAAAYRWLERLPPEDDRVIDAFLDADQSSLHMVGRLTSLIELRGGAAKAEMPDSAMELVEHILVNDVIDLLDRMRPGENGAPGITDGEQLAMAEYKLAADAVGLDFSEIMVQALGTPTDLKNGPISAD